MRQPPVGPGANHLLHRLLTSYGSYLSGHRPSHPRRLYRLSPAMTTALHLRCQPEREYDLEQDVSVHRAQSCVRARTGITFSHMLDLPPQASKPGKQGHSTYLLHETRHPFSHHQLDDRLFRPKQLVHSVLHGLDQFSVYLHDQVSGLCARRQYLHMHRFEERREKGRGRARRGKGTYGNQATPCCRAVGGQF